MSPQAAKELLLDRCYFGTQGIRITRDAYRTSLGGATPNANRLPSFGEFPDIAGVGQAKPEAPPPGSAPTNRLPFIGHSHSCALAKTAEGAEDRKLDEALETYGPYAMSLVQLLVRANEYYKRKDYQLHGFADGEELDRQLKVEFATLDERLDAIGAAMTQWRKGLGKVPDKLDVSGEIGFAAIGDARQLTMSLLAKAASAASIRQAVDRLTEQADKLDKEGVANPQAPFPRGVGPALRAFILVATDVQAALERGPLSGKDLYRVTATFTELSSACYRALVRHLHAARGTPP